MEPEACFLDLSLEAPSRLDDELLGEHVGQLGSVPLSALKESSRPRMCMASLLVRSFLGLAQQGQAF